MALFKTINLAIYLVLLIATKITSIIARDYEVHSEWLNYLEAWESCKEKGLQLATAQTQSEFNHLGALLYSPVNTGKWFWATNQDIDRTIGWDYVTLNDGELTLISKDGQTITTRCLLVRDYPPIGTRWSEDLCYQKHQYICDKLWDVELNKLPKE